MSPSVWKIKTRINEIDRELANIARQEKILEVKLRQFVKTKKGEKTDKRKETLAKGAQEKLKKLKWMEEREEVNYNNIMRTVSRLRSQISNLRVTKNSGSGQVNAIRGTVADLQRQVAGLQTSAGRKQTDINKQQKEIKKQEKLLDKLEKEKKIPSGEDSPAHIQQELNLLGAKKKALLLEKQRLELQLEALSRGDQADAKVNPYEVTKSNVTVSGLYPSQLPPPKNRIELYEREIANLQSDKKKAWLDALGIGVTATPIAVLTRYGEKLFPPLGWASLGVDALTLGWDLLVINQNLRATEALLKQERQKAEPGYLQSLIAKGHIPEVKKGFDVSQGSDSTATGFPMSELADPEGKKYVLKDLTKNDLKSEQPVEFKGVIPSAPVPTPSPAATPSPLFDVERNPTSASEFPPSGLKPPEKVAVLSPKDSEQ